MDKKIIFPNQEEIEKYSNKKIKIIIPEKNPIEDLQIKEIKKDIKNKFCSNIKVIWDWKEIIKNILNNTDYGNDKR